VAGQAKADTPSEKPQYQHADAPSAPVLVVSPKPFSIWDVPGT
jgi:hypothetical protein